MSLRALFYPSAMRLMREKWGVTFQNAKGLNPETNQLIFDDVDSGVQPAIEEVLAILLSTNLELQEPFVVTRGDGYTGPLFTFQDDSQGPTIRIEGDNQQTDINLGDIIHSTNITNNNEITDGPLYNITNVEGDINYGDEDSNVVLEGDDVTIINPGGDGGGGDQSEQEVPGKIVGGSGEEYTIDLYGSNPFQQQSSETITGVKHLGADPSWLLPWEFMDIWVMVRKSGDERWFITPPVGPTVRGTLFSTRADHLNVVGSTVDLSGGVAKPYELRRTPFDGETNNGISYEYTADESRNATVGAVEEVQQIIPEYNGQDDDEIVVTWVINGTGVEVDGVETHWLDTNNAARAWAGVCV